MENRKWSLKGIAERAAVFCAVSFLLGLSSCYYDNEEDLYGITCDTTAVSYSADIWPIIETNCQTGCHAPGGSAIGHIFTDHASVLAKVTNGSMMNRVVELRNMPPSGVLTDCQVNRMRAWILQGALDN
jgi:hypothetical protein